MSSSSLTYLRETKDYAEQMMAKGSLRQAITAWRECVSLSASIHGKKHSSTMTCTEKLGICLSRVGFHGEALRRLRTSYKYFSSKFSENDPAVIISTMSLALGLYEAKAYAEAVPHLKRVTKEANLLNGALHFATLRLQMALAECLMRTGDHLALIQMGVPIIAAFRPSGPKKDKLILQIMRCTAKAYHQSSMTEKALALVLNCIALGRCVSGPCDYKLLDDMRLASRCLWQLNRRDEAVSMLEEAMTVLVKMGRQDLPYCKDLSLELENRRNKLAKQAAHLARMEQHQPIAGNAG
jgi:tetratricopeptide (TPR) repeat protein